MTGLPSVACPVCNTQTPLDVLLGHQGARDALVALAGLHKSQRLQLSALRYVGLFAPAKQTMRFDRVADVLGELRKIMEPGTVTHKGRIHAAPIDYWINAMDDMLARRSELTLPMANHNYLVAIVAGYSDKAEAITERSKQQTAAGATPPVGHTPKPAPAPVTAQKPQQKKGIPQDVASFLGTFGTKTPKRVEQ